MTVTTAREYWQQRVDELDAETNPYPDDSSDQAWWEWSHALRKFGAVLGLAVAPAVDMLNDLAKRLAHPKRERP